MLLVELAQEFGLDQAGLIEILKEKGFAPPRDDVVIAEKHVGRLRTLVREHLQSRQAPASVSREELVGAGIRNNESSSARSDTSSLANGPVDGVRHSEIRYPEPTESIIGTVSRVSPKGDCFLTHELAPRGIYYSLRRGSHPLQQGDIVQFRILDWHAQPRPQAVDLEFIGGGTNYGEVIEWDAKSGRGTLRPTGGLETLRFNANRASISNKDRWVLRPGDTVSYSLDETLNIVRLRKDFPLRRFARIGDERQILDDLAQKALKEKWDYPGSQPLHILRSYLYYTFSRLEYEDRDRHLEDRKIRISRQENRPNIAVFDTGLVNHLYHPIYGVFEQIPRIAPGQPGYSLLGFCSRGERIKGTTYLAFLRDLPDRAEYFDNPGDLLYDPKIRLDLNYEHIIGDRSSRLPPTVRSRIPKDLTAPNEIERFLAEQIDKARERAEARIRWNYKAAIPQYYEPAKSIQLLLPLCLDHPEKVDVALAVQRKGAIYTAETILELNWAYSNARLITRPDSDWLAVRALSGSLAPDGDDE